jgi:hypothetical protein
MLQGLVIFMYFETHQHDLHQYLNPIPAEKPPPPPFPSPPPPDVDRPVVKGEYIAALEFTATDACRDKSLWRLPTDLNAGSGGQPLHMCIMGHKEPPFLTSLTIVASGAGRASCPAGTNQSTDLNAGLNTGEAVFACTSWTSSGIASTLIKDIIPVIGAIALCPSGYSKISGNLNAGVLNAPTVSLCVLSKCVCCCHCGGLIARLLHIAGQ